MSDRTNLPRGGHPRAGSAGTADGRQATLDGALVASGVAQALAAAIVVGSLANRVLAGSEATLCPSLSRSGFQ